MISFECDYNNGAHAKVLERLVETNEERTAGYGFDQYTEHAKALIREACGMPDAQIWFLAGGTQTNATVVDSILHTYEGVVSVDSGHINTHEAGAIEFTEHKIITLPGKEGKMEAQVLDDYLDHFMHDGISEHSVFPGMAYITFPTEYGTMYTARELDAIYQVCQKYEIPLYVDGARLGYGLMADGNDISLPYLARHCDVFYIGGTKIGALCGEAVVFPRATAHPHFFNIVKQHGALMAKGRLIGAQFEALFTDDLYFKLSRHANDMAMRMKRLFERKGYPFYLQSPTNQQFVVLSNDEVRRLDKDVIFTHWGKYDSTHTICRFVTSWSTTEKELDELERIVMEA